MMNKLVKALFNLATQYTENMDDGTMSQLELNHICAERFAELVVMECIDATGNCAGTGYMIKEHFGM